MAVVFLIVAAVVGGFLGGNAIARQRWAAAIASGECLAGPAPEEEGAAAGCVGLLRIPRFGDGWTVPIRGDTSFGALGQGVGWVAGTTAPGQIGNCVIVGQRLGAGQPFFRLRELEAGDLVEVETASHIYVYALDIAPGDLTVTAKAAWVLDPVPGASDLVPQTALLSLVTAQDLLRTGDRSVGVAVLLETREK
ncbi:MAG: class E sortase [Propionibacteriaceae bacterium]|nr:class E sortase [Propionibacteriaceae bacterium]